MSEIGPMQKRGVLGKYLTADQLKEIADRDGQYKAEIERLEARLAGDLAAPSEATSGGVATEGLRAALLTVSIAGHRRVEKYAEQESEAAARKDWSMADRWRYLASGNAETIAALDAALSPTSETSDE